VEPPSRLAKLRSGLLALVIFISLVDALPLSSPPSRKTLGDVAVQEELGRFAELFTSLGHPMTTPEMEDAVFHGAKRYSSTRSIVLKPFKRWRRETGTGQAWGFFGYPETHPYWIVVEGRPGPEAPWETLYEPRSGEHDLLRSKLRYRRVQFMWVDVPTRGTPGATTGRLADHVAPEVFEERPDLNEMRLYIRRGRTPRPGKTSNKAPKQQWPQVRKR
jgi:hypothetical protein